MLDLQNAYFHIPIKKSDTHKTAFVLPWNKFEWKVLCYGLVDAPFTFTEAMTRIFSDLQFVVIYFDDILIFSKTAKEHLSHLRLVLDRLLEYRLHINESKLCRHGVTFLGFDVNQDGLKINPGKIQKVVEFTVPKNLNELRKFLDMTGFLRRFIDGFSNLAAPFYDLLKKGKDFSWDQTCTDVFIEIKYKIKHADILILPDFTKPIIYCNAADRGIG